MGIQIWIGYRVHDYQPPNLAEAYSVAAELARDNPRVAVTLTIPGSMTVVTFKSYP